MLRAHLMSIRQHQELGPHDSILRTSLVTGSVCSVKKVGGYAEGGGEGDLDECYG